MGDILMPQAVGQHATVKQEEKQKQQQQQTGLTADVDSSLAMAAANLSMFSAQDNSASNPWAGKPVCWEGLGWAAGSNGQCRNFPHLIFQVLYMRQ